MIKKTRTMAWMISLLLVGCSRFFDGEVSVIQIKTTEQTNQGAPFYVIVKNADFGEFLQDDYQKIVAEQLLLRGQEGALEKIYFIPGVTKTIQVPRSKKGAIGIYCMFTNPGDEWKCYVESEESQKVKLLLGESEIQSINRF